MVTTSTKTLPRRDLARPAPLRQSVGRPLGEHVLLAVLGVETVGILVLFEDSAESCPR